MKVVTECKEHLDTVARIIKELNSTNSLNDKKDILAKYEDEYAWTETLYYTYNPYYRYYVTSDTCKKYKQPGVYSVTEYEHLFDLLLDLNARVISGHHAINCVRNFIEKYPEHEELIYNIIDRDIKCRVGIPVINKIYKDHIPTFDVALAEKFEGNNVPTDLYLGQWYVSRKLDGVRCLIVVDDKGMARGYSRAGNEFETIGNVLKEIESLKLKNIVFDGEICIIDKNGTEDFQGVMKEIRRKNHTMSNPMYKIFDCLSLKEFNLKAGKTPLSERLQLVHSLLKDKISAGLKHVGILEQELITGAEIFVKWQEMSKKNKWEGLMVRKNVGYKGKRSKDLLKVKEFHDAEYVCTGVEIGPFRHIVDGKEVTSEMVTNVLFEHKGNQVSVGSGFTVEQRMAYHKNPNLIVGKTITIQYFEETKNQNGTYSLRFPVVKHVYENGRNV